jgi:murein DD-endopeptidase MepM/ murein hydrolase activator NlpD
LFPPARTFSEHEGGIESIDYTFDIGLPAATATVSARAKMWDVPIGSLVHLADAGMASGPWMVESITETYGSIEATITLVRPRPTIPEPIPPPTTPNNPGGTTVTTTDNSPSPGTGGGGSTPPTGAASGAGYVWPVHGTITSGFGPRGSGFHAGLDIAVPVGTKVLAAQGGVVTNAEGGHSGYGNLLAITNGSTVTRYGHVSGFLVTRGQRVTQGQPVALSGGARGAPGAGDSTGPHVHFEIRPNDKPTDPRPLLPAGR